MDTYRRTVIKAWAEDDKPREKLILKGKSALSDAELLAIVIGSGNKQESAVDLGKRILNDNAHSLASLARLGFKDLLRFRGIGPAKAIAIIAALELGQRRRSETGELWTQVNSSKVVFEQMQPLLGSLSHEEFWVLLLNNANRIVHKVKLSKGGLTGTVVDIRILCKWALNYQATAVILAHNHPSGKLSPSEADLKITKKIKDALALLDISLLDHLIVTEFKYYSFADEGVL